MDHQLNEEQIRRLNKISKLPREEQQKELQSLLSELSPEQIEFLKSQQKEQQCLFCSLVEWHIPHYRVYEDSSFIAILDINPASKGHVMIIPKKHNKFITEIEGDFSVPIKKITKKIYENLKADVSIIINNGLNAGQKINHTSISIIPRYKNDNINLELQQNKASEDELKELSELLKIPQEIQKAFEEKIIETEGSYEEERIP